MTINQTPQATPLPVYSGMLKAFSRVTVVLCLVCASLGCRTTTKTSHDNLAMAPQEQAHRDQLAAMGREDAATAKGKPAVRKRPTAPRDRRTGQGTIDQPRR